MIAVLKKDITPAAKQEVMDKLREFGLKFHATQLNEQTLIAVSGAPEDFDIRRIKLLEGIHEVFQVNEPYKLASKTWKKTPTTFDVRGVTIGGPEINMIAGPCAVESEEQIFGIAEFLSSRGVKFIRGGAYKPRTSPYSFQGLRKEGLKMIRAAADKYNLRVVTEVIDLSVLEEVYEYADILQVGTRNMMNFYFLAELGKTNKPVMLKRGMSAKITEWLMAAEYILSGGNEKVILCERGIRTFDDSVRNTLDVAAFPIIKELSHLPVMSDPSHGTGFRSRVTAMSLASVAAGADGLMLELHQNPEKAFSDGPQSLYPQQFDELLEKLKPISRAIQRSFDFETENVEIANR